METLNARAGFLCNFEVLHLLQAQRDGRAAQVSTLRTVKEARLKKSGQRGFRSTQVEDVEIERINGSELSTVTLEVINYLEESIHSLRKQSKTSISTLMNDLDSHELTKGEKLQIVNSCPLNTLDLVVTIDDFEERFNKSDESNLLQSVQNSMAGEAVAKSVHVQAQAVIEEEIEEDQEEEDEEMFVDEGLAGEGEAQSKELDED